jgi:hypothetical protein
VQKGQPYSTLSLEIPSQDYMEISGFRFSHPYITAAAASSTNIMISPQEQMSQGVERASMN